MTAQLSQPPIWAVAAGLLALTACARETPVDATRLSSLRAGEWAFEGTTGQAVTRGRVCLEGIADALGRTHAGCSGFRYSRGTDGALIVRDRCVNPDGAQVETRMRLAGDLTRRMRFEDDIRIAEPGGRLLHTVVRVDYRYLGACPASR
jgi:hypothetical protein